MTLTSTEPVEPAPDDLADRLRGLIHQSPEQAADLLLENAWTLFFDDPPLVGEIMERMPERVIAAKPGLVMLRSFLVPLPTLPSRGFTQRLRSSFPFTLEDLKEDELEWYFMALVVVNRMRGDFAEAQEVARRVRPRLRKPIEQHRVPAQNMLAGWFVQIGAAELLAGDPAQALRDFDEAATIHVPTANGIFRRDAVVRSALVHALEGRLQTAEEQLARAETIAYTPIAYAARVEARVAIVRALIAVEQMRPDAEEALAAAERTADDELWAVRLLARTRWELARGHYVATLDRVDGASRHRSVDPDSFPGEILASQRMDALALMGIVSSDPAPEMGVGVRLSRIRRSLHDPAAALQLARQFIAADDVYPSGRLEALLLAAWAQELLTGHASNDYSEAARSMIQVYQLVRPAYLVPARIAVAAGMDPARVAHVQVSEPALQESLTRRERDVLRRLTGPETIAEIAEELHVSVNTVKTQVRSVYKRLGVNSRDEAVRVAAVRGLLDD